MFAFWIPPLRRRIVFLISHEPFDCIYAGHILLKGEDGAQLLTPFEADVPVERIKARGYRSVIAAKRMLDIAMHIALE